MTRAERWWPYLTVARFIGVGVLAGCAAGAIAGAVREVAGASHA